MGNLRRREASIALACLPLAAWGAGSVGEGALRTRYATLARQLADSPFGAPIVLNSEQTSQRIEGEVHAVLDQPFERVSAALADPAQWCDILILHLNTKFCSKSEEQGATRVGVRIGKNRPQAVDAAALLVFRWRPPTAHAGYLAVQMDAGEGPYGTRDYRLLAEAVPVEGNRTFLHMGYGFGYGATTYLLMHVYLGFARRERVGFTRVQPASEANEGYVVGMRGVAERNTMRYFLAVDAYLASLAAPPGQQVEKRLAAWYDATERYARQLHEIERADYLQMKRSELQRQAATR